MTAAGATLSYEAIGSGVVVLILHGAYSTRDELRTALEPIFVGRQVHRRVYVDLPGMGESAAHESIVSSADVLVDCEIRSSSFGRVRLAARRGTRSGRAKE